MIKKIFNFIIKIFKNTLKVIVSLSLIYLFLFGLLRWVSWELSIEIASVKRTIHEAREEAFEIELTGVTQQVIEINKRLARYQRYSDNKHLSYLFIEGFNEIEPIK